MHECRQTLGRTDHCFPGASGDDDARVVGEAATGGAAEGAERLGRERRAVTAREARIHPEGEYSRGAQRQQGEPLSQEGFPFVGEIQMVERAFAGARATMKLRIFRCPGRPAERTAGEMHHGVFTLMALN